MKYSRNPLIPLAEYPTKGGSAPEIGTTSDGFTSVNLGSRSGTVAELELRGGGFGGWSCGPCMAFVEFRKIWNPLSG